MENPINITTLNDFIFCPMSIYFHNFYMEMDQTLYQNDDQINGTYAHKNIDTKTYRINEKTLSGISVYSEKYNLLGKIDLYYPESAKLVERKKKIKTIYDGYVFQLYGQYFAMKEMGYKVEKLAFHSIDDNKTYAVNLPGNDKEMFEKFDTVIRAISDFDMFSFIQDNPKKCEHCIYESMCDRSAKNVIS